MAEKEKLTVSRLIGYTPEADSALKSAARRMGITEADAANNAAVVYDQVVHAGLGPGKTLLIIDDRTGEIEGGVRIRTKLVSTDTGADSKRVVSFRIDPETPEAS